MKKTLIISSLLLILIVLMTSASAADNTTTLTQQNDEIITIENEQINEIEDCLAGIDTNFGLEQNFTSESQTLSPKNTDSQSKKLETNFKNNILTATNTDDLLTADRHVSGNTFADIQAAITNANPGDNIFLDGKTYYCTSELNYVHVEINKTLNIYGGSNVNDIWQATLDAQQYYRSIWITENDVILNNIKFINGKMNLAGGCALCVYGNNTKINNCTFTNNQATQTGGGALSVYGSKCMIFNSEFINNNATTNGGAIYWTGANGTVDKCQFTGNNATNDGDAIRWLGDNGNVNNCNLYTY